MSMRSNTPLAEETLLTKEILVDAIIGAGFPSIDFAIKAEKVGLAVFTCDGHNESWAWKRCALAEAGVDELHDLYLKIKEFAYAR